ncbi:hypothetical protein DPMN_148167 [Dreissena polymorpha]|uniref:Uncharacterized protein n=1 Tax=Dreissena polymorpha TaxID=45954 RepID=A0A9D4J1A0_DREPO|nr:hypothetical protein DPMN_148167 [Dreissena polymorpha]
MLIYTLFHVIICCSNQDACNKLLCGIRQDNTNRSLCYFCDSSKSVQASVSNPSDCITLTTCDTDQICRLLMKRVFEDLRHCAGAGASGPECQHETLNCDVCCGDEACNYGDCRQLKARLYNLMVIGKFNNVTLQVIP